MTGLSLQSGLNHYIVYLDYPEISVAPQGGLRLAYIILISPSLNIVKNWETYTNKYLSSVTST